MLKRGFWPGFKRNKCFIGEKRACFCIDFAQIWWFHAEFCVILHKWVYICIESCDTPENNDKMAVKTLKTKMAKTAGKISTKMTKKMWSNDIQWCQHDPKMTQKWPKLDPKLVQNHPNMIPIWRQNSPKWPCVSRKKHGQKWPKMVKLSKINR